VAAVLIYSFYVLILWVNPYDEVQIAIRGLPPDTRIACLVAEGPNGEAVMPWSIHKVFPAEIHPDAGGMSEVQKGESEIVAFVRWINGRRIGILRKADDGNWSVAWFDGRKTSPEERSILFGHGRWNGNWAAAAQVEEWSEAKVRSLGFDYFLRPQ
jgi:hypothetical protein